MFLRQSTAAVINFGPFVDKADGVTLKTDATTITDIDHASTGIFLSKNGATAAIRNATVTASVASAYGMMLVTLDATDTNTVGRLKITYAKAATYLPVHESVEVLEEAVYDALFAASAAGYGAAADTAAIKVQTDKLAFTVANVVDANVQRINDVPITGDGSASPFGV